MEKVADRRVGKPLNGSNLFWRVKCDLEFEDLKVALAFKQIVKQFETSAIRREGRVVGSVDTDMAVRP